MAKSPAFQFYASDFLTETALYEEAEVCTYIRLLSHQWVSGGLPADPVRLARLAGLTPDTFKKAWVLVGLKFPACSDGLLRNPDLEQKRIEKENFLSRQQENGKKGGRRKKTAEKEPNQNPSLSFGLTQNEPKQKPLEDEVEIENEIEEENENHFEKSEKLSAAKSKSECPGIVLPFDSEAFVRHWEWWRQYKREQFSFRYKSVVTEQAALNDLTKIANGDEVTANGCHYECSACCYFFH